MFTPLSAQRSPSSSALKQNEIHKTQTHKNDFNLQTLQDKLELKMAH